jgi:hypothetical protein
MIIRDKCLHFLRGYKYQVARDYHIKLAIIPYEPISLPFVEIDTAGDTVIKTGYAWNGASGPTLDTRNTMAGSLVHDLLYQLIRLGLIDSKYKEYADRMLKEICIDDGMNHIRATCWLWAVHTLGGPSCKPDAEPKEEVTP